MPTSRRLGESGPFLVLSEHRLPLAAIELLLSNRAALPKSHLLVTVTGPSGIGKSHLLRHALKSRPANNGSDKPPKTVHKTASQFAAEYAAAVERSAERQFQTRHRKSVDLFILEDIQALATRTQTQQQLIAALDDIMAHGGACILSASKPVGEIRGLSRRLVNRIHGGVCVHIDPLSAASRNQLAHYLAAGLQRTLTPDAAEALAAKAGTPAEMLGQLRRIVQETTGFKRPAIDRSHVERTQETQPELPPLSMDEITRAVAREFQVSTTELRGEARTHGILVPRQVAMYLVREVSQRNYGDIGKHFGGRNHNTAMHACQRVASMMADNPQLARQVEVLKDSLRGPMARPGIRGAKSKKRS